MPFSMATVIADHGLGHRLDQLQPFMVESVRIETRYVDMDELKIGDTRMGGVPDLPPSVEWPRWQGVPQSLIAQVNLSDLSQFECAKVLPHSGYLYFFYDSKASNFGGYPEDRGGWKVLYADCNAESLTRTAVPPDMPEEGVYGPCAIALSEEMTIKGLDMFELEAMGWSEEEISQFQRFTDAWAELHNLSSRCANRLLGYADQIQGDIGFNCELAVSGQRHLVGSGEGDALRAELEKRAVRWRLLLQVDSDDQASMSWVEMGRIYFCIPEQALEERDFDQTWLVVQCL